MDDMYSNGDVVVDPERFDARAIDSLVDLRGKDVVEVGCGSGRITWSLAAHAKSVLAIDPRAADIAEAIAATPDHLRSVVRFVEADAVTYGYANASFDVAVLSFSL